MAVRSLVCGFTYGRYSGSFPGLVKFLHLLTVGLWGYMDTCIVAHTIKYYYTSLIWDKTEVTHGNFVRNIGNK